MFRNSLKYYHGTSETRWKKIEVEGVFKPSHLKKIGDYWITQGAYFVCENPYIALWYAHVSAMADNCKPIVICIEYEIKQENDKIVLNLLTADGHKLLAKAHNLYKKKLNLDVIKSQIPEHGNLDSYSLELLMSKSDTLIGVIAFFQEGQSFQSMILEHKYANKYTPQQKGFSPGDHIEICFYPEFKFDQNRTSTFTKKEIIEEQGAECNIWELVCEGLTLPIENDKFKKRLSIYLNKQL